MPGFAHSAQHTATPPFPMCLPDGNSNVIEISARAKSHLQGDREREREGANAVASPAPPLASQPSVSAVPPTHVPCLVLISALLKTAALLFLLLYFFPISSPSSSLSLCLCLSSLGRGHFLAD